MSNLVTITRGSNFYKVTNLAPRLKEPIFEFIKLFIKVGEVKFIEGVRVVEMTKYLTGTRAKTEYRFHINSLPDFKSWLQTKNVPVTMIDWQYLEYDAEDYVDMELRPNWILRDYQEKGVDFVVTPQDYKERLLEIQTGKGKGITCLAALARLKRRFCVIVKPQYIQKWEDEIVEKLNVDRDEVLQIKEGSENLKALINLAKQPSALDGFKAIIISNKLMQIWFTQYEQFGVESMDLGYNCLPEEFFQVIRCGVRVIDEVHQDFHFNFKLDLYTNTRLSISMSATLINKDPIIEAMYALAYPYKRRYSGEELDKYINAICVQYYMKRGRKPKISYAGKSQYSHNAFEEWIMKDKDLLGGYLNMIATMVEVDFIKRRKEGQKAIVFCSTVDMCTLATTFLKKRFPDVSVLRYTGGDPKSNLHGPDIRVTTPGSGGTAHDIANLITTVNTVSINSIQAVIQMVGRLRKQDDETHFLYTTCVQIAKHRRYNQETMELLRKRCKSVKVQNYGYEV